MQSVCTFEDKTDIPTKYNVSLKTDQCSTMRVFEGKDRRADVAQCTSMSLKVTFCTLAQSVCLCDG
jgi:hypothetical protein